MVNICIFLKVTFLAFCLSRHKVTAQTPELSCNLLQGCGCLLTADKTYEFQCPEFFASFMSNYNLQIRCNYTSSLNYTDPNFEKLYVFSLQKLTLFDCPISAFLNSFSNLSSLRTLSIRDGITTFPINNTLSVLKSLPYLNNLDVSFTKVDLPEDLFSNNLALEKLYLAHNSLKELPPKLFQNLVKLACLDLSYNEISILPDAVFFGLRSLRHLNLNMNKLTTINSLLFYDLQNLAQIDLSHNEVFGTHIEAFQRLINLKVANLSYNLIEFDGFSPFYSNLKLEKLDLSHNRISHMVNDLVVNKINLEELNLSYNEIGYVEISNLLTVAQNARIELQGNKIALINFTNANAIQSINSLDNNELPSKFYSVTTINLNDNPIICDCNLYDFIKYLSSENKNMIFQINRAKCASPQSLNGFPLIKLKLNVLTCALERNTCPETCACSYRQWDNTIVVDCSAKNLRTLPDLKKLSSNGKRIEMYLQDNLLNHGPQQQMGYENVTKLIMSRNAIHNFSWVPPKLEVLEIEHNHINFLSYDTLLQLESPKLKNLVLGNNPWECDCTALAFNNFLISKLTTKQIDVQKIECSNTQKLLVYLNPQELCTSSKSYIYIVALVVSVVALVLSGIVITVIVCKFRRKMVPKMSRMV